MGGPVSIDDSTTIDTGTAVWEIELSQRDRSNLDRIVTRYHTFPHTLMHSIMHPFILVRLLAHTTINNKSFSHLLLLVLTFCYSFSPTLSHPRYLTHAILITSRIIIVDLPAIDPLVDNPDNNPSYLLPSLSPLSSAVGTPFDMKSRSRAASMTFHGSHSPTRDPWSTSTPLHTSIPLTSSNTSRSPQLHHSIHTFDQYIRQLLTPQGEAQASFRTSKLTHYLAELLGGNAVVVALGFLTQGQPAVSRKTIEVMDALSNLRHFPVGNKELTTFVQRVIGETSILSFRFINAFHQPILLRHPLNIPSAHHITPSPSKRASGKQHLLIRQLDHECYRLQPNPTEWPSDNKTVTHSNNEWDVLRREHDSLVEISEALNHSHQAIPHLNTPYRHILSIHCNTSSQHTFSKLYRISPSLNSPSHQSNTPSRHIQLYPQTLSIHFVTHLPSQSTL